MIVESNGNSRIVKKTNSRPNSRILNSRLAPLMLTGLSQVPMDVAIGCSVKFVPQTPRAYKAVGQPKQNVKLPTKDVLLR